jgi:RING finger protein 113A
MSSPSSSSVTPASTSTAPLFKKKRSRPIPAADATTASTSSSSSISARRNADDDDDDDDDDNTSTIVHKSRKVDPSNALIASSGISLAKRNRLAAEKAALEAEEDAITLEDEYSSVAARVKVGENGGSKQLSGGRDDATRQVDWYDEDDNQKAASTSSATAPPTTNDDGLYRGTSSYTSHLPQSTKPTSKYTQKGPIKAPTNIRTVTVMDYQPDVCKDYKEMGYCGFGDTCKFLHDRSDYLAGWQMEAAF